MSISEVLKVCAAIYFVVILIDFFRSRRHKRFLLELLPLICLLVIDVYMASTSAGYLTFGSGSSPTVVMLIMFGSILLGFTARYVFYLRGKFSWLNFVKPLCISLFLASHDNRSVFIRSIQLHHGVNMVLEGRGPRR